LNENYVGSEKIRLRIAQQLHLQFKKYSAGHLSCQRRVYLINFQRRR